MKTEISESMRLAKTAQQFLTEREWSYELARKDNTQKHNFRTHVTINRQTYSVFIDTDEDQEVVEVYLYSPFSLDSKRVHELAVILNRINMRLVLGRFATDDDDDSNPIQWKAAIDVEGGSLSVDQLSTMVSAGCGSFRQHAELLSVVGFTKCSVDEAWDEFMKRQAQEKEDATTDVPVEL